MTRLALALLTLTCSAPLCAQTGDWPRLESLRHGATLVVETNVNPYGPATFDRCRLKSVEATTLTCTTLGWAGKRVVFPAGRIDAVYRVKQPWIEAAVGLGSLGTFLGGVAAGCASATGVGIFFGAFWLIYETSKQTSHAWHDWWYGPNPLPEDEHRELVYLRPLPPPTN